MPIYILIIFFSLLNLYDCQDTIITSPRLVSQNGNLKIYPGYNRNISLEVSGDRSWINVGDYNIVNVLEEAINATRYIQSMKSSYSQDDLPLSRLMTGRRGILWRLANVERSLLNMSTRNSNSIRGNQFYQLRNRVTKLRARINALEQKNQQSMVDQCASTPCQNGGTCIDTGKGYHCLCPNNWEGKQCSMDVNECAHFAGTDLGCQNGATCINRPGSYECHCASKWFGLHCTKRTNDCLASENREICGHGICVPFHNDAGYKCICDQGWTTPENSLSCTQDVNECTGNMHPCSVNPMVPCINIPGSFVCGSCPLGYAGNGYFCTDVNECLTNNGGCSVNPMVDCINTVGSRVCGACPPGYEGNGVLCTYVGLCKVNNGGCHPFASCSSNPMISSTYVQCQCRDGYTGSGYGPIGCLPLAGFHVATPSPNAVLQQTCDSNPCVHGVCQQTTSGIRCICDVRYTGILCDQLRDPCNPQPCKNGGTCVSDAKTMGYRCECTSQFTGHNCETRTSSCGGVRDMEEGHIIYPNRNSTKYSHDLRCYWLIVTQKNKVLNVTFTRFNLEGSPECLYDWLQIHDGLNSASHNIGRFCGNTLPMGGNIISTRNVLYLWFRTDHSVSKNGFELTWTSIDPICGRHINATSHGTIKSPGSPGQYPSNRDCYWIISAPLDKRIQIHFYTMQIEEFANCDHDYLAIYDGPTVDDNQLAKYCGKTHPTPLLIKSPSALVYFHSDAANNDYGFQLSYAIVEGEPGCGATYTQDRGEITPPKIDNKYMNFMTCEYRINLTPDTIIKLSFKEFGLEYSVTCQFDYVAIYDGDSRESPLIGKYCGTTIPPDLVSSSNNLLIVFVSDQTFAADGFRIVYEKSCQYTFTGTEGIIKSPGYPKAYPSFTTCKYYIKSPPKTAIVIRFDDFDLEVPSVSDCKYDSLSIYDSDVPTNATLIGSYCGDTQRTPDEIISTHNHVYMEFITDTSVSGTGFKINYTTIPTDCGGILKDMTGTIEYPVISGNEKYEDNLVCRWVLSAPPGYVIHLNKLMFDLENSDNCFADYVQISNNDTSTGKDEVLGRYCGSKFPATITSSSNLMTIKFVTDSLQVANGFSFLYLFSNVRKACGGTFLTSSGVITSPGYPDKYPNERDCIWTIKAPDGQQIALNISAFQLEWHYQCNSDYLEIRNGAFENSPLVGKFCGSKLPSNLPYIIPSQTNSFYLKFHADSSKTFKGFYLSWDSTATGCGGTLTSHHGSIISPNYPSPYGHNAECYWRITTSAGSAIQLVFVTLDLERVHSCLFDYVMIYDGYDKSKLLGKYCTIDIIRSPILSTANSVFISFHSDGFTAGMGFMLNYNTMCHRNITDLYGVIESPNFPNNYPDVLDCIWKITVPKGNKINVTFSHFDLEITTSETQKFDYVSLYEGNEDDEHLYSGVHLPPQYHSTSNEVTVHFHTDPLVTGTGFRLEWAVDGCGGHLTHPSDTFTSPNYPHLYPIDTECHWLIEVDPANSIILNVNDIDTEFSVSCDEDPLEIFDGPSDKYPSLAKLCGKHEANFTHITSSTNYMYVKFHSDFSFVSRGIKATYTSTTTKCGGLFKALNGTISSPNYPKNYENNLLCVYHLEVPDDYTMLLNFLDLDLAVQGTYPNCSDSVKVFDGDTLDVSRLLGTVCHRAENTTFVSSTNKMTLQFESDDKINSKGFMANYRMRCDTKIVTSGEGVVSQKNFVMYDDICVWTIQAENLDDKVSLTLTLMNLESFDNCSYNYVEVFSGDSVEAPSLGRFCHSKSPPTFVSRGNSLTVSIQNVDYSSFSFYYSVLKSACGSTLRSLIGEFSSPMYPDTYAPNLACIWNINVTEGNSVTLIFTKFKLQTSEKCDQDYLEIRQDDGVGRLYGVYCNDPPPTIKSSGSLWIKFSTDSEIGDEGFLAEYSYDKVVDILDTDMGVIASPLYPVPYRFYDMSWRITVTPGSKILLTFRELNIRQYGTECYFALMIYDGYSDDAPLIGSYCGQNQLPDPVRSSSNVVFIKTVEADDSRMLFRLEWLRISQEIISSEPNKNCGDDKLIFVPAGSFHSLKSPGFPEGYNESLKCEWIFTTESMQHFVVRFVTVSLEETFNCMTDRIILYNGEEGTENWKMIGSPICLSNSSFMEAVHASNIMKIVFETDVSVNKSGFHANIFSDCGNNVTQSSGIITPNRAMAIKFSQRQLQDCEWDITVGRGRTIKVEFLNMSLTMLSNVCSSYVLLRDGGTNNSPLLGKGKYCRETEEANLTTTSNRLHITYHTPVRTELFLNKTSFQIRYSEVMIPCGDRIVLGEAFNSVEVTSPNYPEIPNPHTECEWLIIGQAMHRLSIDFIDQFDLFSTKGCDNEYVEVRDGGTQLSKSLGKFCLKPKRTLKTTGNMLYLKFFTGLSVPSNGFKAKISIDICGGTIYGARGKIDSPNELDFVFSKGDIVCDWYIFGPESHSVYINIMDISLLANSCNSTYLQIYDKELNPETGEELTPLTDKICGMNPSVSVKCQSNKALVRLTLAKSIAMPRVKFTISFNTSEETCGGDFNQPSGVIELPKFRGIARHNCVWKITVPEGRRIKLAFEQIGQAPYDFWIGVYNGHQTNLLLLYIIKASNITNRSAANVVESSSNKMLVAYWGTTRTPLNVPIERTTFKMTYSSDEPTVCIGKFAFGEGIIDPPTANLSRIYCEYPYQAVADFTGTIMIERVNDDLTGCYKFPTQLYYSVYAKALGIGKLGNLCSTKSILSPYKKTVLFMEKGKVLNGFSVHYRIFHCGGEITDYGDGTGIFTLPTNHTGQLRCVWVFKVPFGEFLTIKFNNVVFGSKSCNEEFLQIKLGTTAMAFMSNKICYDHIPNNEINLHQHDLWLEYSAENFTSETVLNMTISLSSEDESKFKKCGGSLNWLFMRDGVFHSPHFPKLYSENQNCEWMLYGNEGYRITLQFENRFYLETSPNCTKDYVEVFDYKYKNWESMGKFCGRNAPPALNSTAERMKVVFNSDESTVADGFQARWSQFCGGIYEVTTEPQTLRSPGKGVYGKNLNCTYILTEPSNRFINLKFDYFILEAGANCKFDYLSINQMYMDPELFCGLKSPGNKRLTSPLTLQFKTDEWVQKKGFSFQYYLDLCGGNITKSGEVISSSTDGNNKYFSSTSCVWFVKAPEDHAITLVFQSLTIEYSPACIYDYIEVFDSFQNYLESSQPISKMCGNLTSSPPKLKSKGTEMVVVFKTDPSSEFEGFSANVIFTYDEDHGCGGFLNLTQASTPLHIFSNKKKYEPFLDCHWIFKAPVDHHVQLTFSEFNVSACFNTTDTVNCRCDYLEVRDGPSSHSELIGIYCGDALPDKITSSKNFLWIRFVSDGTVESTGIQIYASSMASLCGPSVLNITDEVNVLMSPGFTNGQLPAGIKCEWLVMANNEHNSELKFTDFDVGVRSVSGEQCIDSYLQLTPEEYTEAEKHIVSKKFLTMYYLPFDESKSPRKLCGNLTNYHDQITYNNVKIKLVTVPSKTLHRGFRMEYVSSGCTQNITKSYGRFVSRGIDLTNCVLIITAPENHTISLYLDRFLAEVSDCENGYLEFLDGVGKDAPSLRRYCTEIIKSALFSTGNTMTVNLVNAQSHIAMFTFDFISTDKGRGCGGLTHQQQGRIMSPFFPIPYRENNICEWVIDSMESSILITFEDYDIGFTVNCDSNYLELVDRNGQSLVKYCTRTLPAPFTVLGNYVKIVYHTSVTNYGSGWSLSYNTGRI